MGTESFPGVNRKKRGVDHPPTSSAGVKERLELYLYSPSGPSWTVLGWTLPFLFVSYRNWKISLSPIPNLFLETTISQRGHLPLLYSDTHLKVSHLLSSSLGNSKQTCPRAGLTNLWCEYPKWHADRFPWQVAFTALPGFYFFCPTSISILWRIRTYIIYIYTYMLLRRDSIYITVTTK